jgi:hypothetical protein
MILNISTKSKCSRPFGFAIRMLEYKDLQSETNHSNRIINPYTPIRRIINPAIEPILRCGLHWLHAITSAFVIVSLRTIQKSLICRQFWIVRKLTMTDAEGFSQSPYSYKCGRYQMLRKYGRDVACRVSSQSPDFLLPSLLFPLQKTGSKSSDFSPVSYREKKTHFCPDFR